MPWKRRKTIYLIRHAESTFNVLPHNASIKDPLLSSNGQQQAKDLVKNHPYLSSADLIVSSPLRRTLYTAVYAFGEKLRVEGKKIMAVPELQELSKYPCDTGSPLQDLEKEFRGHPIDFKMVDPNWDSKEGYWAPTERRSLERVGEVRSWLQNRPEQTIVVVGHGHCIQLLVEEGCFQDIRSGLVYPGWRNTEVRSYQFERSGSEARLVKLEGRKEKTIKCSSPPKTSEGSNLFNRLTEKITIGMKAKLGGVAGV